MRSCIVIKERRSPALRIVAIGAGALASFRKMPRMRVLVTILANLRRSLELDLRTPRWHLVAITALHDTMCTQQRELCLRVVESSDVRPGPRVMTPLAA